MNKTQHDMYIVVDDEAYARSLIRLLKSVGYAAESFLSAQSFLDYGCRMEKLCFVTFLNGKC